VVNGVLDGQLCKIENQVRELNVKHGFSELKGHYRELVGTLEHYRRIYVQKNERLEVLDRRVKMEIERAARRRFHEDPQVSHVI
jgi:hypothetical protein